MSETLWTVSKYIDSMREGDAATISKAETLQKRFGITHLEVFPTRDEAIAFMLRRAETRVESAKKELKTAEKKLKALRKRYEAFLREMRIQA